MIMSPMISLPPIRISVFSTEQNRFCKLGQHAYECSHILNAADIRQNPADWTEVTGMSGFDSFFV